ncbi:biopolymer transporter ExbD [Leptospira fletcheri]|uniref:Biopolymer transporter ExbD n=1 Tax=Leptospira fletcheri TaxID=2484981 RepID=A0A4R9GB75_9LEPT|nr:biopolymer transporter ExbD [Leptospira fletcheri]TGK08913.1 biopolymer transporter ExbD [Leptospira fletcheri]
MKRSVLREDEESFDLTSFIDVVFILLIFVMLSVSFRKEIRSIPLNLPSVGNGEDPKGERIEIVLLPDGSFRWNGSELDRSTLESRLAAEELRGKEVRFFADENAGYGVAVRSLDLLRKAGVGSLELAVRKPK